MLTFDLKLDYVSSEYAQKIYTEFKCTNKDISSLYTKEELNSQHKQVYNSYYTLILMFNNIVKLNNNNFILFTAIQYIDLSHNKLTIIEHDLFKFNTKLVDINLSNNNIKHFNLNLNSLKSLTRLDIHSNNMSTLQEYVFSSYFNNITFLDITHNNIACDCSTNWIRKLNSIIIIIRMYSMSSCRADIHKYDNNCFIKKYQCETLLTERDCLRGKFTYIHIIYIINIITYYFITFNCNFYLLHH